MGRLRVLVVDDHRLVLEAVRAALEGEPEIDVVGEALSGQEALTLVERLRPDVVLLDLGMPVMDGIECLEQIRATFPSTHVAFLTGNDDPGLADEVIERGASAFVSKHVDPRDLAAVLRQIVEGTVVSQVARPDRGARADAVALTKRERDVLGALAEGQSNKQIARQLQIGEQAVKYHLTNLYRKLGTANRVGALRRAAELGLGGARVRTRV